MAEIIIAGGKYTEQALKLVQNWMESELNMDDHIWFCRKGIKFILKQLLPDRISDIDRIPEHWSCSCMWHLVNAHKNNNEIPVLVFVRSAYGCEDDMFHHHLFGKTSQDAKTMVELIQYANENIPDWQALFFECAMLYIDSLHLPRLRYETD